MSGAVVCYARDLADEDWALIAPLLPSSNRRRLRKTDLREVDNTFMYMVCSDSAWHLNHWEDVHTQKARKRGQLSWKALPPL
jgi:transposase